MKRLLLICLTLLAGCTGNKSTNLGNGEAYSGYRPKDGQYFWVDSRATCLLNGVQITGYRGVIQILGTVVKYRKACDTTDSIISLDDLKTPNYGALMATSGFGGIVSFQGGLFDGSYLHACGL